MPLVRDPGRRSYLASSHIVSSRYLDLAESFKGEQLSVASFARHRLHHRVLHVKLANALKRANDT